MLSRAFFFFFFRFYLFIMFYCESLSEFFSKVLRSHRPKNARSISRSGRLENHSVPVFLKPCPFLTLFCLFSLKPEFLYPEFIHVTTEPLKGFFFFFSCNYSNDHYICFSKKLFQNLVSCLSRRHFKMCSQHIEASTLFWSKQSGIPCILHG